MIKLLATQSIKTKSGSEVNGFGLLLLCVSFLIGLGILCILAPDSLKPVAGGGAFLWGAFKLFSKMFSR